MEAKSVHPDSYCMLVLNTVAHKFLPLLHLFCAWHWSSMSPTMSVYLSNHTKWPPITCPIDLSWWWKLVDKTFIPPHYCSTFISSKMKAAVRAALLTWDKSAGAAVGRVNIGVWSGWMMAARGQSRLYRVMHRWGQMVANGWNILRCHRMLFSPSPPLFHHSRHNFMWRVCCWSIYGCADTNFFDSFDSIFVGATFSIR